MVTNRKEEGESGSSSVQTNKTFKKGTMMSV